MQITQVIKTFEIYSSKYSKWLSKQYHLTNTYPPTIFDTFQIPKLIQRREDVFSRKATNHTSKGGTLTHSRLLLLYQITINSIPRVFTYIRNVTLSCVTFHLMQSFSRFRAWKSFCYSHIAGASLSTNTICNDNANISTLTGITCALFDGFIQNHNFPLIYAEFYKPNIT